VGIGTRGASGEGFPAKNREKPVRGRKFARIRAPGWQYAWGNGRATMKYGTKPIGFPLFSVHVSALVDAWGNCTPAVSVRWF